MTDVERAAFVLAHPAATYTIPIPLPPMATVGDDLDGYCEEDALSEADALDSAVDVEMSRLPDGRYTLGVPVVPDAGAERHLIARRGGPQAGFHDAATRGLKGVARVYQPLPLSS